MRRLDRYRSLARATRQSLVDRGARGTWDLSRNYVGQNLLGVRPDLVQHRYHLSERLAGELGLVVRHGPFTGLRLSPDSWWSAADRGAMLLGLYEQPVLEHLASLRGRCRTLIDVGAADGYYAIGALVAGIVETAICFEASEAGRRVILRNAELNDVADRIVVLGTAGEDFLARAREAQSFEVEATVVIVDIEGGEFDLLTRDVLAQLSRAHVIVELHESIDAPEGRADTLIAEASAVASTHVILPGPRDPSSFEELRQWSDDDRWLLCSESRAYAMRWLVMSPQE